MSADRTNPAHRAPEAAKGQECDDPIFHDHPHNCAGPDTAHLFAAPAPARWSPEEDTPAYGLDSTGKLHFAANSPGAEATEKVDVLALLAARDAAVSLAKEWERLYNERNAAWRAALDAPAPAPGAVTLAEVVEALRRLCKYSDADYVPNAAFAPALILLARLDAKKEAKP